MKAEYDGTGADTKTGDTALTFATYDGWRGSADGVLSEKMRISSSGNVGINITSPKTKLHLNHGETSVVGPQEVLRLQGDWNGASGVDGDGALIRFTNQHDNATNPNTGEYNVAGIAGLDDSSNWGGSLHFQTSPTGGNGGNDLQTRMVVRYDGNVGINITSPETKLNIESNTSRGNETLLRFQRPGGHGYSGFNQYYNLESGSGDNYVPALWGLNFGLGVTNDSNGKVGIKFESGAGSENHTSDKIIFRTSGTNQVDIDNSGNLTASGTITSSYDITLKENIELISDPIEKVKELGGYTFNKKGEDLRLVGLIAQAVEKVLPEAVHENQEGLKSLAYGNLVALLVECVKNQDERIESLERTIKEMK